MTTCDQMVARVDGRSDAGDLAVGDYLQVLVDEPQFSLLRRGDVVRVTAVLVDGFKTDGRGLEWTENNTTFWGFDFVLIGKYFRRIAGIQLPEETPPKGTKIT